MKDNSFKLANERNRRYPAQKITDGDCTYDIVLLAPELKPYPSWNPSTSSGKSSCWHKPPCQYSQNGCMCFNQRGEICTLNDRSLKFVDKFTYLGSSVSSTDSDINTRLAKERTARDSLLVIWKSDLADKIKYSFFKEAVVSILI